MAKLVLKSRKDYDKQLQHLCNECKECEDESSKHRGRVGYGSQFSSLRNLGVSTNLIKY